MKALNTPDGSHAPEIQAALDWLSEQGKDGKEHLVVLDGQTLEVRSRAHGCEHSVPMNFSQDIPGDVYLHNHPCLNSLSDQDLMVAQHIKAGAIYCISIDGSVYRAMDLVRQAPALFYQYTATYKTLAPELYSRLMDCGKSYQSDGDHRINVAHWINDLLCKKYGLFRYDYWLGKETQDLVLKINALL